MDMYLCTCCPTPQPARFDEQYQEWLHVSDVLIGNDEYAMMYHLHDDTSSRDCDGPLERHNVTRPAQLTWFNLDRDKYDTFDVWRKVAASDIPLGDACEAKVTLDAQGQRTLTWSRRTDEGYEAGCLTECTDPECAHDRASQRDIFAEQMGY